MTEGKAAAQPPRGRNPRKRSALAGSEAAPAAPWEDGTFQSSTAQTQSLLSAFGFERLWASCPLSLSHRRNGLTVLSNQISASDQQKQRSTRNPQRL